MRTILVTGGAGFIGINLCAHLLGLGHKVTCLDDFSTSSAENIAHLRGHPRFSLKVGSVTRPIYLPADEIYNLACPASPVRYQKDPVKTLETCVLGAANVLALARRAKAKVLQASTSEVYGEPQVHPQGETYWGNVNPIGPRACYNESKRCAETLFYSSHEQYGVSICIARIFNTYGPRMLPDDGRVVPTLITQALKSRPMIVFGNGEQTRSFCYIDDLVKGLVALMASDASEPVNLGYPQETSILELAMLIRELTGTESPIIHYAKTDGDPNRRRPDITLAKSLLGWNPETRLFDGLTRTIDYFRGKL